MAIPQTASPIPLGVPALGMNVRDPLAKMDLAYAPWMLNWEPEPQYLRVRNGHVIALRVSLVGGLGDRIKGMASYFDNAILVFGDTFVTGENKLYATDFDPATLTDVSPGPVWGGTETYGYPFAMSGRVGFVTPANANLNGVYWNGTATAWGFTESAASIGGYVVKQYKGRVYIFNGTNMYYSTLAGITGATSLVDLSSLFESYGTVCWAGVLASPTFVGDDTYLAFGLTTGEILVYAGDNPGATNWGQIAKFKTSRPIYYNSILEFQNDIWIATETGMVSLRKCFQSGSSDREAITVSGAVNDYWTTLCATIVTQQGSMFSAFGSVAYWPQENKVYCLIQGHNDVDGTWSAVNGTMFVHNLISGAWCIQMVPNAGDSAYPNCLTYYNNNLYYLISDSSGGTIMKIGTGYKDEAWNSAGTYSSYSYSLQSAYTNLGNANRKRVTGFEPLIKTDFDAANITMKAATDFGRKVSAASSGAVISGYQAPFYSVGGEGTYFQYRLEGTTKTTATVGLELYSVGAAIA